MKPETRSRLSLIFLTLLLFALFDIIVFPQPIYDFDGDGRTDFVVERFRGPDTQLQWFILQSRDGFAVHNWGYQFQSNQTADNDSPGDYDGDGKWDISVTRMNQSSAPAFWYVRNSTDGSMTARHWGMIGDIIVPQDYDGDGKTDFAVFRFGWWYILRSIDGQFQAEKFGTDNDDAFMGGDYDGDGKADLAVRRFIGGQVHLYIRYSITGWWAHYLLGSSQATGLVSGDYDGDGKADVAIWSGNTWLWERSSDGQLGGGYRFGDFFRDTPVPGDYDGDGKTDIAVFRPFLFNPGQLNNYFFILQSRDGFLAVPWGSNQDANVFDHRYLRASGFRPTGSKTHAFEDKGSFPRLVETGKN